MQFKQLENDMVILKPMETGDVAEILSVANYSEIWSYLSTTIENEIDVERFIHSAIKERERGTAFPYVVIDPQTGKIIGSTRFMDIDEKHNRVEIGFTWLTPAYWRTSMNTNCKYLLLQYCFEVLNIQRVQIKTDDKNLRSQKAIERIGAMKEGILRNHMTRKDGSIRNTVMYSIIKEEWPTVKAHLELLLEGDKYGSE